jgi:hypothetical protein
MCGLILVMQINETMIKAVTIAYLIYGEVLIFKAK